MGQRQNQDEIVYGDYCGFISPPEKTPKYIYVRFSNVVKCTYYPGIELETPPNDRVFKLTQDTDYACWWVGDIADWHLVVDLQFNPGKVIIWLTYLPTARVYFYSLTDSPLKESYVYHNIYDDCPGGDVAVGGFAVITWRLECLALMKALNIKTEKDLFMELHPLCDGNLVFKFCRLKDATNIAIKLEPD